MRNDRPQMGPAVILRLYLGLLRLFRFGSLFGVSLARLAPLEGPYAFSDGATDLRKSPSSEYDEDDRQNDDQLRKRKWS